MVRQPGVHVTEQWLQKALQLVGVSCTDEQFTRLVKTLGKQQLTGRNLVLAPTKAVAAKLGGRNVNDHRAQHSYARLTLVRAKRMGKLRPVKPGQAGWADVVEAADAAARFCERFEIAELDQGETMFYELVSDVLKDHFTVRNVPGAYDRVCARFEQELKVLLDQNSKLTDEVTDLYVQLAKLPKKLAENLRRQEQRIHFVTCVAEALDNEVPPADWVKAQFSQLEWTGTYPTPKQLSGEPALMRVMASGVRKQLRWDGLSDKQKLYRQMLKK